MYMYLKSQFNQYIHCKKTSRISGIARMQMLCGHNMGSNFPGGSLVTGITC